MVDVANKSKSKKKPRGLTYKQQLFVDHYEGNATEAARKAGYKGNNNVLGAIGGRLLRNVKVLKRVEKRQKDQKNSG